MKIRNLLIVLILALLWSCQKEEKGFTISGKLGNAAEQMIFLHEMTSSSLTPVDSVLTDTSGNFELHGISERTRFYALHIVPGDYIYLLAKTGDNISLSGDGHNLNSTYRISGSNDSELIQELTIEQNKTIERINRLSKVFNDSLESPDFMDIKEGLDSAYAGIVAAQRDFTFRFIENNLSSQASLMALYQQLAPRQYILDPLTDIDYYEKVDKSLYSLYPESEPVITLHSHVTDLKERKKAEEMSGAGINQGDVPPEISLTTPDGETLSLSSTRGKVVLLDFWAAWCSPCRQENPNLVSNYNKYKDKGFDIFQVSLDKDKASWVKGIEEDKLGAWKHVSDLKYWQSSVVPLYNIQSIPANYLLDKEGKVIGVNLRGPALGAKLEEVFAE